MPEKSKAGRGPYPPEVRERAVRDLLPSNTTRRRGGYPINRAVMEPGAVHNGKPTGLSPSAAPAIPNQRPTSPALGVRAVRRRR